MGYFNIWKKYKVMIISMAAFVAWLWFFPLFGIMQTSFQNFEDKTTVFNLMFFGFKILGFLVFLFLINRRQAFFYSVSFAAPITAVATLLMTFAIWYIHDNVFLSWNYLSIVVFVLLPAFAGLASAIYFAFWGTTIFYVAAGERGRYMAAMVAVATIIYALLVIVFNYASLTALFLSGILLILPSIFIKTVSSFIDNCGEEGLQSDGAAYACGTEVISLTPWKTFWLPFAFIILCFYIVSWAAHDIIFSAIKTESILSPIVGQLIYALTFIVAAVFLDREKKIDIIAVLGLIALGCSFLLLPIVLKIELLWPLYFFLESSYGLIDLFVWVSLAYYCQLLKGNPMQYYGRGLMLNILFIMAGIILIPIINVDFIGENYYILSVIAGIILFMGVLPALSLRNLRLVTYERIVLSDIINDEIEKIEFNKDITMDSFTKKEKEVAYLMLAGQTNTEIIEKLGFSKNTLKTHVRNIYRKASVKNRSELLFVLADHLKRKESRN